MTLASFLLGLIERVCKAHPYTLAKEPCDRLIFPRFQQRSIVTPSALSPEYAFQSVNFLVKYFFPHLSLFCHILLQAENKTRLNHLCLEISLTVYPGSSLTSCALHTTVGYGFCLSITRIPPSCSSSQ